MAHDRYGDADRARFVTEPPKSTARSPFQRDRARILHSSALRRLGAKTQVLGAGANDFVRTRLTHSLEVAQVGRDIGQEFGCDPDIVDAACLCHDLGHPPFGHHGEAVLDRIATGIGGFEGNAQTLRLLTRLEPKILGLDGPAGLNLTRAVLDATCKYPWGRGEGTDADSPKFGVYEDDREIFAWMRRGAPDRVRSLEAQVMDLSDDIAYSVHDIEDAVNGGSIVLERLDDSLERRAALGIVRDWYLPDVDLAELDAALARLEAEPYWVHGFDGSHRAQSALKDMASQLIGRFTSAAVATTREVLGERGAVRYGGQVHVPRETELEIAVLKGIAAAYVMTSARQKPVYDEQEQILRDLVGALLGTEGRHLEAPFTDLWEQARDDGARLRVIIDQVASFTDVSARTWHRLLYDDLGAPTDAATPLF